jgi:glucose-1-phosphate cytidylyltransferase
MQVVILCGGEGTRIRDVAEDLPKPMLPIGDQPILWHIMKGYARHGFKHFVLCLGYKSWVIKRYFLENHLARSDFSLDLRDPSGVDLHAAEGLEDWRVTLAETGLKAMPGSRLKQVERYIDGEDFLLTYGDGVADVDRGNRPRNRGRRSCVGPARPPGPRRCAPCPNCTGPSPRTSTSPSAPGARGACCARCPPTPAGARRPRCRQVLTSWARMLPPVGRPVNPGGRARGATRARPAGEVMRSFGPECRVG